jgi:phosphoserine phosphatase RsbU/P
MGKFEIEPLAGKEILIVDDTPENLRLLVKILQEQKYKVRPVPSGNMALKVVENFCPDLILLDINMPGLNGYETCIEFKKNPLLKEIPVVFLSAMNETIDKLKAFKVGGIDYITKPYQVEEVLVRVETHLKLSSLQQKLEKTNEYLEEEVKSRTEELIKMYEAKKDFELELKVASEIQQSMAPSGRLLYSKNNKLQIYGESYSAKKVDGDFFDYFQVSEDVIFYCIGDISGKGIPAAIFMSKVKALLCYEAKQCKESLVTIIEKVNDELVIGNDKCMFASVLCGYIDMKAEKMICCNAGHTYPFSAFGGKLYECIQLEKDPVLGVFNTVKGDYTTTEYDLQPGDTFFIYSDGISEAINVKNEMYGLERLGNKLNDLVNSSAVDTVLDVLKDVKKFIGSEPQSDDITMVSIKYKK